MVASVDFIATYGEVFEVAQFNLNGNNSYKDSEYLVRMRSADMALKELVLKGLIDPLVTSDGFSYQINQQGISFCESLTSEYSVLYLDTVVKAIDLVAEEGLDEIMKKCKSISKR